MNSDGITMNYTFQSHYYKFLYYLSNSLQRRALHGYPLSYSNSRGIFLKQMREMWWNRFCFVLFCFVFVVIKPCDGAQLHLKRQKRILSFSSRYNVTLKLI